MTPDIKSMVPEKAKVYQRYLKHGRSIADYQILRDITSRCKSAIKETKSNYFSGLGESLNDPAITPEKYVDVKQFSIEGKNTKNSSQRHNNTFVTDTIVKANTFNSFLANQCSLIERGSELPADYLLTHHRLDSVNLDPAKSISIIHAFDVSKAHDWNDISVRMVKICDESDFRYRETVNFPKNWNGGNIVPMDKKGNNNLINNQRPASLPPIFSIIYESCIYDTL